MQYFLTIIYGIILLVCTIQDLRKKSINKYLVVITAITMVISGFVLVDCSLLERVFGLLLGILFFVAGLVTRGGIGLADSIIITAIGIGLGISGSICVLAVALTLSGCFALVYIATHFRKGNVRKKTIPFLPFLFAGFIISEGIIYLSVL